MQEQVVYVGTYTRNGSEGIYLCHLDTASGELRQQGVAATIENPSYLTIDAARRRLYAVSEVSQFDGRPGGAVTSFSIDPVTAQLSFINQQFSHGAAPCYLTLHPSGRYLFAVNYEGGNVVVFPLDLDGALGEALDVKNHSGHSVHPERQAGPHPHSIVLASGAKHAFVPDLGLDRIMQYRFEEPTGQLTPNRPPWVQTEAGSGPRHIALHPQRPFAYVVNELDNTVTAYRCEPDRGTLKPFQTISTLPAGYSDDNLAAALHLTPGGDLLFASNRGHDSIAIYAVDSQSGALTLRNIAPTHGRAPRDFAIDPTAAVLLAANQESDNIVTFRIDHEHAALIPTGHSLDIPVPVCVKFLAPHRR